MRTTFSGLGLALGLAVMVVFMIMASQFKSLRLPFVMLFTIPVSLVGIVLALMAAGQGFSITALMGILMVIGIAVSNGILLVDDANRRLQRRGRRQADGHRRRRALALRPHRHDQPGHGHRPHPHRAGARARLRGQPAAGARGGRRAHLVDDPLAVPRAGDVPAPGAPRPVMTRGARRSRLGESRAPRRAHGLVIGRLGARGDGWERAAALFDQISFRDPIECAG